MWQGDMQERWPLKQVVRILLECILVTACKGSCGKVMFLHLSVSHSVHRGGHVGGTSGRGACIVVGACMAAGVCVVGGMHGRGAMRTGKTATEAGGTHPTVIHSCNLIIFKLDSDTQI